MMWQILNGFYKVSVVRAFVDLGLADKLDDSIYDVRALAEATGTDVESLNRLLRAGDALGLCAVDNSSRISLTSLGHTLRRGTPESMADWVLFVTGPWIVLPWLELATSIRTGKAAFSAIHGVDIWRYLASHPKEAELFHMTMSGSSVDRARSLHAAVDLSTADVVVDVGGGHGRLLAVLLEELPHLNGIVADRPQVLADAMEVLEATGVADRVQLIPTDFFTSVPVGGDVYILSRIIHDWSDGDALTVLGECRRAMALEARLYIIDRLVPAEEVINEADRLECAMEDLDMLVLLGGRERTWADIERLLTLAGFQDVRLVSEGGSPFDIVEARPA